MNIRTTTTNFIILFFLAIVSTSCKKTNIECDGSNPTYTDGIKTIIDNNCISCHSYGGQAGNIGKFDTYIGLSDVLNNGSFENNVLNSKSMPKGGKLTEKDLIDIRCWLDNGHPEM
ncbi:MAG: cytochrome c [Bacteroidetes bacterium]|nr:cytochrome c [Bacteroidota bacterium]